MKSFAGSYGFELLTSSPRYPQSNGLVERTIKSVKMLLKDSPDPYMALLSFHSTPIPWCHFSPAELLMGRKLKTDVPVPKSLDPNSLMAIHGFFQGEIQRVLESSKTDL